VTGRLEDLFNKRPDDGLNRQRYMTMHTSYLLLFPAQETPIGAVPAHLFTVGTDAERFDALAEGANDVTGNPVYESRWDRECTGDNCESCHAFDDNRFN
jgi:hypothetical protein